MADLSVQPKKKAMWPWVLLFILIILVATYFVLAYNGKLPPEYNIVPATNDTTMHITDTLNTNEPRMNTDTVPVIDTSVNTGQ